MGNSFRRENQHDHYTKDPTERLWVTAILQWYGALFYVRHFKATEKSVIIEKRIYPKLEVIHGAKQIFGRKKSADRFRAGARVGGALLPAVYYHGSRDVYLLRGLQRPADPVLQA